MYRLLLLFVVVPLVELILLLYMADLTSWYWTLGLVIVTGVVGWAMAKRAGLGVLRAARAEMDQGRLPTQQLLDGVLVLIAGAVLLTPGIFTDLCGFLLLFPPIRAILRRRIMSRIRLRFNSDTFAQQQGGMPFGLAEENNKSEEPVSNDENVIDEVPPVE